MKNNFLTKPLTNNLENQMLSQNSLSAEVVNLIKNEYESVNSDEVLANFAEILKGVQDDMNKAFAQLAVKNASKLNEQLTGNLELIFNYFNQSVDNQIKGIIIFFKYLY